MKNLSKSVIGILLLSLIQINVFADVFTEREKANQVVVDYFAALNKGNLNKIISLYGGNSVFLQNDAPASRGIKEIKKTYQDILNTIKLNITHKSLYVSVSGNMAVVESQSNGNVTVLKSNVKLHSSFNEIFVLKKIDGKWKINRYMFNSSKHR